MDPISPQKREKEKTAEERAEDVAYVLNHAISCGTTDTFIQPPLGAWVQKREGENRLPVWLSWIKNIFERHTHDEHCHHEHDPSSYGKNLSHWFAGEAAGDVGAVPLTIFVQREFPGFMHKLRQVLEPLAGGAFRQGAKRGAKSWAEQRGLAPEGAEAKAHEQQLYDYEMNHLPQAAVWNMFSVPINLGMQRLTGSKASWGTLATGKIFGSVVSNGLLIGGRAMAPDAFGKWDHFNSTHIVLPATQALGSAFGVDRQGLKRFSEKEKELHGENWQDRAKTAPAKDITRQ